MSKCETYRQTKKIIDTAALFIKMLKGTEMEKGIKGSKEYLSPKCTLLRIK